MASDGWLRTMVRRRSRPQLPPNLEMVNGADNWRRHREGDYRALLSALEMPGQTATYFDFDFDDRLMTEKLRPLLVILSGAYVV